jgi:hypothetical protein
MGGRQCEEKGYIFVFEFAFVHIYTWFADKLNVELLERRVGKDDGILCATSCPTSSLETRANSIFDSVMERSKFNSTF